MNDLILIESQSARTEKMNGLTDTNATAHLNKAKALTMALHQGTGFATTRQMSEYYEVPVETVRTALMRHREEFTADGVKEMKGDELEALRREGSNGLNLPESTTRLICWTPRAALRLGMLLRDSAIAKAVRTVLLDIVESTPQPRTDNAFAIRKIDLKIEIARLELQKLELQREDISPVSTISPPRPVQQELDLDIVQRFNESKAALLKAQTLKNEYKALSLAPKPKYDLATIDNIESVEAYIRDCTKLDPNAKVYIGKADGNPNTHFYPNYINYCVEQGMAFVAMQRFSKVLMQLVYTNMGVRLFKGKDRVGCHVKGIAIAA